MTQLIFPAVKIPTVHAPFGGETGDFDIQRLGVNWSAGAAVLKIASEQGGSALITLTSPITGGEGIDLSYDSGMLHPTTGVATGGTLIRPLIAEATLEGLSWGQIEPDQPLKLWFDLLVTPSGGQQRYVCEGPVWIWKGIAD